jgi:hypothetical protein
MSSGYWGISFALVAAIVAFRGAHVAADQLGTVYS